jgi:hypothetical protein
MATDDERIARAFIQETRDALAQEHRRITHCLRQLDDTQVWQRPAPQVNAVGTILLHLCGNLRHWFLHGFGGEKDVRNRPREFVPVETISKDDLQATFSTLIMQIDGVLRNVSAKTLLEPRIIQGFEGNGLSAIYSTITHLEGHALQVSYITHMLVGDNYEPFWKPANADQGG